MKVAFQESGKGRPLVLLHAFPLSRKMWKPQIDALVETGCRVILPDLRGFGETPKIAGKTTMEDLANDVKELLDLLEIEKAIIGGLSMGGYVTLNLYRLYPDKFATMFLADTSSFADTEEKRKGRFSLIEKILSFGMEAAVEEMLPNLISDHTKTHNQKLVKQLEKEFLQTNPEGAIAALRGMAERLEHTYMLKDISVPTLLIFGKEDKVTDLEGAKVLNERIPNSKLEIIQNIGHYSNLEDPEHFNRILVDFVRGH